MTKTDHKILFINYRKVEGKGKIKSYQVTVFGYYIRLSFYEDFDSVIHSHGRKLLSFVLKGFIKEYVYAKPIKYPKELNYFGGKYFKHNAPSIYFRSHECIHEVLAKNTITLTFWGRTHYKEHEQSY